MKRAFSFVIGAFTGGLIGAVAALLLTPESGPALRRRVQHISSGWVQEVQSAASSRRETLESQWKALME